MVADRLAELQRWNLRFTRGSVTSARSVLRRWSLIALLGLAMCAFALEKLGEVGAWASVASIVLALLVVAGAAVEQAANGRPDVTSLALRASIAAALSVVAISTYARRDESFVVALVVLPPVVFWILGQSASAAEPKADPDYARVFGRAAWALVGVVTVALVAWEGATVWRRFSAPITSLPPVPRDVTLPLTPPSAITEDHRWHSLEDHRDTFRARVGDLDVFTREHVWSGGPAYRSLWLRPVTRPPLSTTPSDVDSETWRVDLLGPTHVSIDGDVVRLYADGRATRFVRAGDSYRVEAAWRTAVDDPRHAPWVVGTALLGVALAAWVARRAHHLQRDLREIESWSDGTLSDGVITPRGGGDPLVAPPSLRGHEGAVTYRVSDLHRTGSPFRGAAGAEVTQAVPASRSWLIDTIPRVVDAQRAWALIVASAALAIALPVAMTTW